MNNDEFKNNTLVGFPDLKYCASRRIPRQKVIKENLSITDENGDVLFQNTIETKLPEPDLNNRYINITAEGKYNARSCDNCIEHINGNCTELKGDAASCEDFRLRIYSKEMFDNGPTPLMRYRTHYE